ncbi:ABC transporter permease [Mycobacterium interjectum]|uniref:ABC transporter permease n=1 Tax=Mycobacterium interjectum TaxID=33895 RepID=UPI000829565E|nr:ABC transporter permease [Mycobacterium interjectum]MCV7090987.1 ABC transporter permease [Mycobacterium interjectum]
MTAPATARPGPSALAQWWVLTCRFIAPTLRNGELVITIASSAIFTAGFYIPLHQLMGAATRGIASSYAQYIMPLIALQAITFAAMSTAFRAATDSVQGINRRFKSMPIAPATPVAARISAAVYRCLVSLAVALVCGHLIGFRFHRSAVYIVAFCTLVLVIGALLSFGADVVGTATRNPEAMTPLLILPPLIFGLLSVGVQPVEQFPRWIQPIVRDQPVSRFVDTLRALAGDTPPHGGPFTWSVLAPSLAWLCGLAAMLLPASATVLSRRAR